MNYTAWNEVTDTGKLEALIASMQQDGWIGCPLVADNDQLLTGSHRWAAAQEAGIEAPVIDVRELVVDWDMLIDETGYSYEVAIETVARELPAELKAEYGIDIH